MQFCNIWDQTVQREFSKGYWQKMTKNSKSVDQSFRLIRKGKKEEIGIHGRWTETKDGCRALWHTTQDATQEFIPKGKILSELAY